MDPNEFYVERKKEQRRFVKPKLKNKENDKMIYDDQPTNRRYLEQQLYSKKLELRELERTFQTDTAVYRKVHEIAKNTIDSIKDQLDLDDVRILNTAKVNKENLENYCARSAEEKKEN